MRIGILIDELAPGSAPKIIGQSVVGLQRLGHICEALVLVDNKRHREFFKVYEQHLSGVKIRYLFDEAPAVFKKIDFRFPGFSFFSLHHILGFFIAPYAITKGQYDIIVAHCQYSAFAGWGLKILRGIPYLLLVWDPSTYTLKKIYSKTWLRLFYPLLYAGAWVLDRISTSGARALITSGKLHRLDFKRISKKPQRDLYPGCFPVREFIAYRQRQSVIVSYDRWDIGNNPRVLLELLKSLPQDIRLFIGGFWHPESIRDDFMREIRRSKLEPRIKLLGPLNERDIIDLCSRAVLHLHPNEEAFGMQTLEAAGCGCCVIIPKGSGATDLFAHGISGYFPKKNDYAAMRDYAAAVFSDLDKSEAMGYTAWQVSKNYDWTGYARRLERIIKEFVNEGN